MGSGQDQGEREFMSPDASINNWLVILSGRPAAVKWGQSSQRGREVREAPRRRLPIRGILF